MRTKKKKVIVEQEKIVYIAEDGEEFHTKEACESYELDCKKEKAEKEIGSIPHFSCDPNDFDSLYSTKFYLVRSNEELETVRLGSFSDPDASGFLFEAEEFPCWIRVVVDEISGSGWIYTLEDEIKANESYIKELRRNKEQIERMLNPTASRESVKNDDESEVNIPQIHLDLYIGVEDGEVKVEVNEFDSGERTILTSPFVSDCHPEFNDMIGDELYWWLNERLRQKKEELND